MRAGIKRVAFVGSKHLGARVLQEMHRLAPDNLCAVVTLDDSKDGRSALPEYERFVARTGTPLHIISAGAELRRHISAHSPDLCVVVGWYWVLKREVLEMVPDGWVGLHASLLPKYRGGSPLVWALINGERESGVSLFYFDEGMDTGDLVAQGRFSIGAEESIADVLAKAEDLSAEMFAENYRILLGGKVLRTPQDHSQATYVAMRKPDDGKIDWARPAEQLHNFIRAQSRPYPGAFCALPTGETLRIWKAARARHACQGGAGEVLFIEGDSAVVACGAGSAICLRSVQVDGRHEQTGASLLKSGQRLR